MDGPSNRTLSCRDERNVEVVLRSILDHFPDLQFYIAYSFGLKCCCTSNEQRILNYHILLLFMVWRIEIVYFMHRVSLPHKLK